MKLYACGMNCNLGKLKVNYFLAPSNTIKSVLKQNLRSYSEYDRFN